MTKKTHKQQQTKQQNKRFTANLMIKSINDDLREIKGVASTPNIDREGDIVEPLGAEFAEEIPLLLGHNHNQPIGKARLGAPTKNGIPFTAKIASIKERGALQDELTKVWQQIKYGLLNSVSIGFKPTEYSFLDGGGIKWLKYEIYELSVVAVPANADATILEAKHLNKPKIAAITQETVKLKRFTEPPLANGAVKLKPLTSLK